jgi:signal transduction histidine kinase
MILAGLWRMPASRPVALTPMLTPLLCSARVRRLCADVRLDTPHSVYAAPLLLTEVFDHLLSNALKYRGPAPLRIAITSRGYADRIHITVSDNGRGIAPDDVARIMQPFQRGSAWPPGFGIGLPVAAQFMRLQHGGLTLCSTPGGGTIVTLDLAGRDEGGAAIGNSNRGASRLHRCR